MYQGLLFLEVVIYDGEHYLSNAVLDYILQELVNEPVMEISLVVKDVPDEETLKKIILHFKRLQTPLSLSLMYKYAYRDQYFMNQISEHVVQLRFLMSENEISAALPTISKTNIPIVLVIELTDEKELADVYNVPSNIFLNFKVSPTVTNITYWKIADKLNRIKKTSTSPIFQDMVCAGAIYNSLSGVCPAKICMMCMYPEGDVRFCAFDTNDSKITYLDGTIRDLFRQHLSHINNDSCNECGYYQKCMGGCPLNYANKKNKYCILNNIT